MGNVPELKRQPVSAEQIPKIHPHTKFYLRELSGAITQDGMGGEPAHFESPLKWARRQHPHDEEKAMEVAGTVARDLDNIIEAITGSRQ